MHDLHQRVQRATVHAEGDRECRGLLCVALQLSLFDAAAAPADLLRRLEAAGGLVDAHYAVCADTIGAHQPAQLDEQPVRVGVLLLRAVELFHALGRLLEAQSHAVEKPSDPPLAGTHVESLSVEPVVHQASDRCRAGAQDVAHSQDVLAQPCHASG